jgi:predicted alpha/beta-hydrolase family hydrolase
VRGELHHPRGTAIGAALVLTHGAGSNREAPLLVAVAEAFAARGVLVLRGDLPFRQARPSGPPRLADAARDREGLREAVAVVRARGVRRVFLGGHSYGGRQASLLAAEDPAVADALLLLSYPLHPPARPAALRTAHFPALRVPALFVHGTRDPFGSLDELRAALTLIPAPTRLHVVEGAGHDLGRHRAAVAAAAAGELRSLTG